MAVKKRCKQPSKHAKVVPVIEQPMNEYETKVLALLEGVKELMIITSDERNACNRLKQRGMIQYNKSIYGLFWATKVK